MIGAVVMAVMGGASSGAIFPAVVGILLAFVAYGRLKLSPIAGK
jgi:hypothetical protein